MPTNDGVIIERSLTKTTSEGFVTTVNSLMTM